MTPGICRSFNVFLIIFVSFRQVVCEECIPSFSIIFNQLYEFEENDIHCDMFGNFECHDSIEYIMFEKLIDSKWEDVFRIMPGGDYLHYNLSNGYTLFNRSYGVDFFNNYLLSINTTIIEDTGTWRCNAKIKSEEDPQLSEDDGLVVSTLLTADDITVKIPDYIVLGMEATYTCLSTRVHPRATVEWSIAGENLDGLIQDTPNGIAWNINNEISYTFSSQNQIDVKCIFNRTDLSKPISVDAGMVHLIYAPAMVENVTQSHTPPKLTDELTLICIGSGNDVQIEWFHRSGTLPPGLYDETFRNISGDFNYGQKTANMSTLKWILPDDITCDNVNQHDGEYRCEAQAIKGDPDTSTKALSVDVQFKPIIISAIYTNQTVTVGDSVTLECKSCSNPDAYIKWISVDGKHYLSDKTEEIITFQVKDNDTIICNVSNQIGSAYVTIDILAKELPWETTTPDLTTTTGDTTTEDTRDNTNEALVIAFAVIWSLCGVFAILLVCLALYHYRQIQNGKKYRGEYSEEIVLTEDEVKPGTSHSSGDYDGISTTVVGKGAVGFAVGGVTNDGLYAEVQRPAQTQMPVAPKRTSKAQASQPRPGTPKTKQTQAVVAPMNARHQPSSPSTGRRPEPRDDYSPVPSRKEIPPKHSKESNKEKASKVDQQQKRQETSNKPAALKQSTNAAKPSVPDKPNITSMRSSRSSGINSAGAPHDNAEVNLYANCDQRSNGDGTITYADLALQHENPYEEGAPPVPAKNMNDQEPVQYASIVHSK